MHEQLSELNKFDLPDAGDRDPRQFPFGYFARDTFVLSGIGVFRWYATERDALIGYAAELLEHLYADADEEVRAALRSTFAAALDANRTLRDVKDLLNEQTTEETEIVWYGSFEELRTSDDAFAKDLREGFLLDDDQEEADGTVPAVIPSERLDGFVEYIHAYGY